MKFGDDVESAKLALVASDITDSQSFDEIVEGINDGSIESIDIDKSGSYNIACEEDGDYLLVAVSYDEDGDAQEADSDSFEYTVNGGTDIITDLSAISVRSARIESNKAMKQLNKNVKGAVIF